MPTIVHFEIPADDVERAKKFYSDLFGWKMERWSGTDDAKDSSSSSSSSPSNMQYWIISTTDDKGNKSSIGGGLMKRHDQPDQHLRQITNFIDVNSVDEYSSKIEKLGGKIVVPKMAVPGMGYFAVCHDTENNSFGIWEANESAK
jgi:predicted enzyme related to lactoylglutathione lyase